MVITKKLISMVLIGGNHLANVLLSNGIMPDDIGGAEEIESNDMRDVWIAWRAIMDFSQAQEAISNDKGGNWVWVDFSEAL